MSTQLIKEQKIEATRESETIIDKLEAADYVYTPEYVFLDMIVSVSKGLLTMAGTKILNELNENTVNMERIREEMAKIVRDANIQNTVKETEGKIYGTLEYINITYANRKKQTTDKRELYNMLNQHVLVDLYKYCSILSNDEYKKKGISTYVVGVNVLFSVLQEMALQDPDVSDYKKSSHFKDLIDYIDKCAPFLNNLKDEILGERMSHVHSIVRFLSGGVYYFYYNDSFDHYLCPYRTLGMVQWDRDKRIETLLNEVSWIDKVVTNWIELMH
ncbi:hypothetical protein [Methanosarcina sp. UBA5]|uniref:hypothetical protein n=1 Tax=Methanosarcina sp. UBA5 TaxID=1915593 RepID=UPI0025DFCB20|nr:hypothetical protein [Methanosarcina sp. UBA5]